MENKYNVSLILENVRSAHNVGSIFRSADCFGIKHIYLVGYTPSPSFSEDTRLPHIAKKLDKQISKTALGAQLTVSFSVHQGIKDAVNQAKEDGYLIGALEQSPSSVSLKDYKLKSDIALVLGNELNGVDNWTLSASDVILEIKQQGIKESLNVASASSIAMYALTK